MSITTKQLDKTTKEAQNIKGIDLRYNFARYYRITPKGKMQFSHIYNEELGFIGNVKDLRLNPQKIQEN